MKSIYTIDNPRVKYDIYKSSGRGYCVYAYYKSIDEDRILLNGISKKKAIEIVNKMNY